MWKRKSRRIRKCFPQEEKIFRPVMIIEDDGTEKYQKISARRVFTPADKRYCRQPDNKNLRYYYFGHYAVLGMCSGIDVMHVIRDKVEPGNEYTSPSTRFTYSKNGAGIVKAMREMGMNATLYGFCGGDGGRLMRMKLDSEDFAYRLAKVEQDTPMGTLICDGYGTETHIQSTSFYVKIREYKNLINEITSQDPLPYFVVISGQPPDCLENYVYQDLIRFFKEKGCKTFLDCTGAPLRLAVKERPDFTLLTKRDLGDRYGVEIDSLAQILVNIRRFHNDMGSNIICDAGEIGYIYCGKDLFATAIPEKYFDNEHIAKSNRAEEIDFEHVNPARRHSYFISSFLWAYEYTCGDIAASLKIGAAMSRASLSTKFDSMLVSHEQKINAMIKTNLKIY